MKHVCISHAPLHFRPLVPFTFISPRAIEGVDCEIIPDDCLGPAFDGKVLSEYLQLFVLADRWRGSKEFIHLFQYRRFVSPVPPPHRAHATEGNVWVSPEHVDAVTPSAERLAVVQFPTFGSIMQWAVAKQYGRHHHAEDFVNFARAMALCGAFSVAEAEAFYNSSLFIVSPSIGLYPAPMLIEHLDLMKLVWAYFRAHFYVPREGYNRRVGGYLLERLQSYLILRYFDLNPDAKANVWYRIVLANAVRT